MQPNPSISQDFPTSQERFWHVNLCKIVLCLQLPQIYGVCGCNQLNWRVSHQDNELCDYDGILSLWEDHFLFHLNFQPRTCWCFDGDSQLIFCDGNVINHDTTIVFQVFMIMLQSPVGKWGLSNMTQSTCVASTHQKNHRLCHNQPFDTNYDFFPLPSATWVVSNRPNPFPTNE